MTHAMIARPELADWSRSDAALWLYLFVPVVIFLPGFFVPWVGWPLVFLVVFVAWRWMPHRDLGRTGDVRGRGWAALVPVVLVATVWTALGGTGHLFYANTDWISRFAVLRDLVVMDWPPRYRAPGGEEMILRAPLGYYLPAALLARFAGLALADYLLMAWTWAGVVLFLAANFTGGVRQRLGGTLLFLLASGLDVLGWWSQSGILLPGGHMEWWDHRFQYSSNTTLLFWVPNHALPGWIAAGWLLRYRDSPGFLPRIPVLCLPMMFWSPLTAVGFLGLAAVTLILTRPDASSLKRHGAGVLKAIAAVLIPIALVAAFLLMSAATIPAGFNDRPAPTAGAGFDVPGILRFYLFEVGFFGMFLLVRDRSPLAVASLLVLAVLPWISFGPNNDLAMRASIPALAVIWLVLIRELVARPRERVLSPLLRRALLVVWLTGAVTPAQEIYRSLARPSWAPNLERPAPSALRGFAPHYFAPVAESPLAPLLKN